MYRNLAWFLALLLVLSALLNAFFVFQQMMIYRDLKTISAQISALPPLSQIQSMGQSIVNDLLEYGKKQPAIYPLLNKYGINTPPPPSASKPATQ